MNDSDSDSNQEQEVFEIFRSSDNYTRKQRIHCKQELIVSSLQKFYNTLDDKEYMISLLNGVSRISLRLIDWFVTNYSKKHSVAYILNNTEFLVYANYKSQLKAYSKKLFDPFCRRERISFQMPGFEPIITTVGKLNFFRWAYEKQIFQYIESNYDAIEKEMNECMRQQPSRSAKSSLSSHSSSKSSESAADSITSVNSVNFGQTRKRRVDSHSIAIKNMQKHEVNIHISFE